MNIIIHPTIAMKEGMAQEAVFSSIIIEKGGGKEWEKREKNIVVVFCVNKHAGNLLLYYLKSVNLLC